MIKDIIILQKRELAEKLAELYIPRKEKFKELKSNLIKVVIGPRRAGKSSFSIQCLSKLSGFSYVNFDDEKLVDVADYNEIISAADSVYGKQKYLLLDEIQNLPKWELFVNRLQRQGYNLIITGSNSNLLSSELATHLTGRYSSVLMFTFSFKEFVKYAGRELTEDEIKERLNSYLELGGYPEPLVKNLNYKEYLSALLNSIIYKDIIKRFKIRSAQGIEDLSSYLISNIGKDYSYNTLMRVTKCKSVHTVEKYLNYLEESFVLFKLNRFSFKVKERINSPKKIYCFDNGFINAKAYKISRDIGRIYENTVAADLKKKELNKELEVFYWKNREQQEVDFVIKKNIKISQLIQVCYDVSDLAVQKREIRALILASKELKCGDLLIITNNYEAEKKEEWFGIKRKIKFIPLWKWLLK
ncbi:ATP-binding protein [Patescibacteria group bacterium]|nr:ATP-binding protein [Patescibacteria group bacterium]MBU4579657.1 ATP-binding protein [Patescibacteria group bacterium]